MRFENAAGKDGMSKPWYTIRQSEPANKGETTGREIEVFVESKDVWGNADPRRKEREQLRTSINDPLAFMKKAQGQLKAAERDKAKWKEERDGEARQLERLHEIERRERRKKNPARHRHDNDDELDGFSLDTPQETKNARRAKHDEHHHKPSHERRHRSRSYERRDHRRRHSRERHRSRSKSPR